MIRSAQAVFFHDGKAFFYVFDLENDDRSLSGLVERRIQILDVDLVFFKKLKNTGKAANAVRNGNRQYVSCLGGEFFLLEYFHRFGNRVDNDAEDTKVRGICDHEGTQIDAAILENPGYLGEAACRVFKKYGYLLYLHV